jgi:hypothetical protein
MSNVETKIISNGDGKCYLEINGERVQEGGADKLYLPDDAMKEATKALRGKAKPEEAK